MLSPTTTFDIKRNDLGLVAAAFVADQTSFIGTRIFPVVPVELEQDKFTKVKVSSLAKAPESRRGAGTSFQRDNFELDQDSYNVDYHGLEGKIPQETVRKYERYIAVEQAIVKQKTGQILRRMEKDAAAVVFDRAVNYPVGATTGHDAGTKFTDYASSAPRAEFEKGVQALGAVINDAKNIRAAMGWKCYRNICMSADIRGSAGLGLRALTEDYTGKLLPTDVLAGILGLAGIDVGDQHYMSGGTDAAPTLSSLWDPQYCFLYRPADPIPGGGLDTVNPGLGFTAMWNFPAGGGIVAVDSYIEKQTNSGIVQVQANYVQKLINKEAGYLIGNLA